MLSVYSNSRAACRLVSVTPHSFHRQVSSSARLLLSIPLVQLRSPHTPNPRRAPFRAPKAPLRSGD